MMKKEKKSHGVQLLIRTVVKDPDGKVLSDTGQKPSRSFVIQFLEYFYGLFRGADVSATRTNGTEYIMYDASYPLNYGLYIVNHPPNDTYYGIVVGTGDTAETNTDYKLDTRLTEGVGAGNITQGSLTVGTTGVVGANVDLEIKRPFTNSTGSTITVKEAGIYCSYAPAASMIHFLIIRDVLPVAIDVPDKCSLTVYYTLRTTV